MRVGNGQVWMSWLTMILVINKCYYVPALSMNIMSVSRLSRDGYHFKFVTNGCSISKDGVFYVHVPIHDGLYILDLKYNVTHIGGAVLM
jgi:hypothetical protein